MPSWFITTKEVPTTLKVVPVRSPSTSSAPSRNMEETAWSELLSLGSWLMTREQLMVRPWECKLCFFYLFTTHTSKWLPFCVTWQVWKWGKVRRKWRFTHLWLFQIVASSTPSRNFFPLRFKKIKVSKRSLSPKYMNFYCESYVKPYLYCRYSGKAEHDETWQRIVLGFLRVWWDSRGVGPRVHQLLAV